MTVGCDVCADVVLEAVLVVEAEDDDEEREVDCDVTLELDAADVSVVVGPSVVVEASVEEEVSGVVEAVLKDEAEDEASVVDGASGVVDVVGASEVVGVDGASGVDDDWTSVELGDSVVDEEGEDGAVVAVVDVEASEVVDVGFSSVLVATGVDEAEVSVETVGVVESDDESDVGPETEDTGSVWPVVGGEAGLEDAWDPGLLEAELPTGPCGGGEGEGPD